MATYRFYMLDHTGRLLTGSDADCASDERAFAWAKTTLGDDARAEIWQGARCVGHVSGAEIGPATLLARAAAITGQWRAMSGQWLGPLTDAPAVSVPSAASA